MSSTKPAAPALDKTLFASFQSKFKGDLVLPFDAGYDEAIARWAHNAQKRAEVVASVKDSEDAALAINFVRQTSPRLPVAIRGGGHSPAGLSSVEGGLVIDLSRYLNGVRIDPEKRLAYVGGGALWKTVDEEAIKYGLATVGGTVNHTGVAGLALGGGYGFLTGEHGLVIDNLRQATMVVGDGRILTASETENPDLFFGIRGGGSNFGVCTEFVLQLHPQRSTAFMGQLVFPESLVKEVVEAAERWHNSEPNEKEAMFVSIGSGPPHERMLCITVLLFYNGSEEEGRKTFEAFYALKPIRDMSQTIPYPEVNSVQNWFVPHGSCYRMNAVTQTRMSGELAQELISRIAYLTSSSNSTKLEVFVLFENWNLSKIHKVSPEAMAFNNRGRDRIVLVLIKYSGDEDTKENAEEAKKVAYSLCDIIVNAEKSEEEKQRSRTRAYGNYADGILPVERSIGLFGSNFTKLRDIKKRYDPEFLFNRWYPIPPAP